MVESVVQSHAKIIVGAAEKSKISVLHVDDEFGLLKAAKKCLELQGPFKVDTASSVDEALKKMKEEEYDIVVCDYQSRVRAMPGKDGLEFLKQLKQKGNDIPFIILTGKSRAEVAIKALNLGADLYFDKISDPKTVDCELEHAMNQAEDRRQHKHRAHEKVKVS